MPCQRPLLPCVSATQRLPSCPTPCVQGPEAIKASILASLNQDCLQVGVNDQTGGICS